MDAGRRAAHGPRHISTEVGHRSLFDPRTGEASGQVVVDATSGNSGNGMRDSKMKKEVLESARYPEIVFSPKHVSGYVAGQESSTVQVAGNFAIHGGDA